MQQTTKPKHLKRKINQTLKLHIVEEAGELNEINKPIRDIEAHFARYPPAMPYESCHGWDVSIFETDMDRLHKTMEHGTDKVVDPGLSQTRPDPTNQQG